MARRQRQMCLRELGQGIRFEGDGPGVRIVNSSPRQIERAVYVQMDREPLVIPFGEIPPGRTAEAKGGILRVSPLEALGIGPESLGDRVLRNWFEMNVRRAKSYDAVEQKAQRFLICVLKDDPDAVR